MYLNYIEILYNFYNFIGILDARSKYFSRKFAEDQSIKNIEIENLSCESFYYILEYIYTGKISDKISMEHSLEMLGNITILY